MRKSNKKPLGFDPPRRLKAISQMIKLSKVQYLHTAPGKGGGGGGEGCIGLLAK